MHAHCIFFLDRARLSIGNVRALGTQLAKGYSHIVSRSQKLLAVVLQQILQCDKRWNADQVGR